MTKVFISYRQDGGAHSARVHALAEHLRATGIEVVFDGFQPDGGPDEGWIAWSARQAEQCDKVLIACNQGWRESFDAVSHSRRKTHTSQSHSGTADGHRRSSGADSRAIGQCGRPCIRHRERSMSQTDFNADFSHALARGYGRRERIGDK